MQINNFNSIEEKIRTNGRLDFADGVALFQSPDLFGLGRLADMRREALHGNCTYFNHNLHLNTTNVCEGGCEFCSFSRDSDQATGAYTMDLETALNWIAERHHPDLTEIHIVNGLHPKLSLSFYLELVSEIKNRYPVMTIKAFSAVEIAHLARKAGLATAEVLSQLKSAGVGALPGGGAEIFADRVRKRLCSKKIDASTWLKIHSETHELGLPSNCTMLFGSIETLEERVEHLLMLRAQQDQSGGFQAFIPLPYHPDLSRLGGTKPSAVDMLRTIAVSRLLLDNIMHIKAYWVALGIDIAQLAQRFGANDIDGTVIQERVYHMSAADSPEGLDVARLQQLVREVGRTPIERDTAYRHFEHGDLNSAAQGDLAR